MENRFGPDYASLEDTEFVAKYQASCFCGAMEKEQLSSVWTRDLIWGV